MYSAEAKNDSNKDAQSTSTLFRAKNIFQSGKNIQTLITLNYQNWPLKITIKKKEAFIIAAFLHKHTIQVAYNNYAYAK